jgi:hypothetical protein
LLTLLFVLIQDGPDRLAGDLHITGHATHRLPAVPAANDLVADLGIHVFRFLIS